MLPSAMAPAISTISSMRSARAGSVARTRATLVNGAIADERDRAGGGAQQAAQGVRGQARRGRPAGRQG